jgi:AraC-like DNA-binding protein
MQVPGAADGGSDGALAPNPAPGRVSVLRAGTVALRHQSLGAFNLAYSGRFPLVLYLFSPAAPAALSRVVPAGSFCVLRPQPATLDHKAPLEVLAVACQDLGGPQERRLPQSPAVGLSDPGVRSAAHELRRVLLREPGVDLAYVEDLGRALVRRALAVAEQASSLHREQLAPAKLRRVLDYIAGRLAEPLPVEELAGEAGLSRAHFARAFRAATGESPHRYVLNQRLQAVQAALQAGSADLATLAARYGFSSQAHLTRAFTRAFGLPPGAYRRMRDAA